MVEDYPRTWMEFERRFGDESACRAYLFGLRWPQGFVCPGCGGRHGLAIRRDLWRCRACRRETSVTAGTIFQDSKLPLTVWFRAMWQVASQKNGISALGLQRVMGFGSYKTAWAVISLLKRWLLGTHQGAIGHEHLHDYLDEFTFRFNRRKSRSRGKLFYRHAQQAVQVDPTPFGSLITTTSRSGCGVR